MFVPEDLVAVGALERLEFEVVGVDVFFEVVAVAEKLGTDWIGASASGFHCFVNNDSDV